MLLKLTTLLLLLTVQSISAQKIVVGGEKGPRLIKWADFTGKPDNNSPYFAYTAWKTNVKFSGVMFEGKKAILNGFEMTLIFDTKSSWVKKGKETDELLKHEQGHFDVGLLYLQEVLKTIATTSFSRSGYKEEFQKLMKEIHQKYVEMGDQYDKETAHSIKREEQAKWDLFFAKNVKRN